MMRSIVIFLFCFSVACADDGKFPDISVTAASKERYYSVDEVNSIKVTAGRVKAFSGRFGLVVVEPPTFKIKTESGAQALAFMLATNGQIKRKSVFDPVGSPYYCWVELISISGDVLDSFPIHASESYRAIQEDSFDTLPVHERFHFSIFRLVDRLMPDLLNNYETDLRKFISTSGEALE